MESAKLAITRLRLVITCGIRRPKGSAGIGIRFAVTEAARVDVFVVTPAGKRVARIAQGIVVTPRKEATVVWHPEAHLRSGNYVVVVEAHSPQGRKANALTLVPLVQ